VLLKESLKQAREDEEWELLEEKKVVTEMARSDLSNEDTKLLTELAIIKTLHYVSASVSLVLMKRAGALRFEIFHVTVFFFLLLNNFF
jgi:hypothetical protein